MNVLDDLISHRKKGVKAAPLKASKKAKAKAVAKASSTKRQEAMNKVSLTSVADGILTIYVRDVVLKRKRRLL